MSDTNINPSDLNSTQGLTDRLSNLYYPNGEMVIKNTSMSQLPYEDRTLRSSDPVKILQGDGIYRNPAFALNSYTQSTQSAMHGIIASMADINDDIKITDPNDPNGAPLTGAAAKMEIAKQTILNTGIAPSGFEGTMRALNDSIINFTIQKV